uniref:Uncharacterized protein n=1 Tax=uncultured marine virus TaxID=186617 RepID=A0A0F7L487_9VIRU|nr:hypothetical protein [uncultured marine virus]
MGQTSSWATQLAQMPSSKYSRPQLQLGSVAIAERMAATMRSCSAGLGWPTVTLASPNAKVI